MARILFDNSRTALAFAAVVIAGAGFVAANFEGVGRTGPAEPEYVIEDPEPGPDPDDTNGGDAYAQPEPPEGWYDAPLEDLGNADPIDDAEGFDPNPVISTDPVGEDYVILEGDGSPYAETNGYPEDD